MFNSHESEVHSHLDASIVREIPKYPASQYEDLVRYGIHINDRALSKMMSVQDVNLQPDVTNASVTTPVQYLQEWLTGFVHVITAARNIDKIIGISTVGAWEDEQIVQGIMELTGLAIPYGDYTNVPFSSWNVNFVYRTVVRFEQGMQISVLEEMRAARIRVDSGSSKRGASALALEIQRNAVGFYGFNSGANLTYGFLNDPNEPAYTTVAVGASTHTFWYTKTFLEIQNDILTMISNLRTQSQDQIDPENVDLTLALATSVVDELAKTSNFGISVRQWMREAYPRIRVVSAPELNAANGGLNVGYLFADRVNDSSTDDGRTFIQVVPAKFYVLGVAKLSKASQEDYSNATAGTMCKRPWAMVRVQGL